jgi:hypothetical protein
MQDRQYRWRPSWHAECVGIVYEFGISELYFNLIPRTFRSHE